MSGAPTRVVVPANIYVIGSARTSGYHQCGALPYPDAISVLADHAALAVALLRPDRSVQSHPHHAQRKTCSVRFI